MGAFVRKWRERAQAAEAAGSSGRETVALHLYGFPFRP